MTKRCTCPVFAGAIDLKIVFEFALTRRPA